MWPPKNDDRANFLIFFVLFLFIQPMGLGSELGHTARFLATVNNFYFINLKYQSLVGKITLTQIYPGFHSEEGIALKFVECKQSVSH